MYFITESFYFYLELIFDSELFLSLGKAEVTVMFNQYSVHVVKDTLQGDASCKYESLMFVTGKIITSSFSSPGLRQASSTMERIPCTKM